MLQPPRLAGGRLVIDLTSVKEAPKACENFKCLCLGDRGLGKSSGKPLHYKGVRMHRIQTGFVVQGGDIVKGDGSGGDSIWGGKVSVPSQQLGCSIQSAKHPPLLSHLHWHRLPALPCPALPCPALPCPAAPLQFKDEPAALKLKHDAAGVVGMANSGARCVDVSPAL